MPKGGAAVSLDAWRRKNDPTHVSGPTEAVFKRDLPKGAKRFIITGAQNATPVEQAWWDVLQSAARELKAEILVVPLRYKNPTSIWTASQANAEHWAPPVQPYLWNQRLTLNPNLMLIADIKIPPTKSTPLSGFDAMSTTHSAIFAHPKVQMTTVPTPSSRMAKILTTTGVVTQENYTDSGLGKISEFHHSLSAVLVELDGKRFYLRHLHFDRKTKSCTDLRTRYFASGKEAAPPAAALVMGDMHIRVIDPKVERARAKLVEMINPEVRGWNDTLDAYSCTPHHEGNPFVQQTKAASGWGNVQKEVAQAIEYIRAQQREGTLEVIVPSNHDDMLTRWIKRVDWKAQSDENAKFYLRTALAIKERARLTPQGVVYPDAFSYWLTAEGMDNVRVLQRDESFLAAGIELGMHGDIGPNGARGSRKNLRRIGVKSVIGHAHSPGIDEGCYQTGTSSYLRLEYNHGASGWLNADVVVNADGKRQVIIYIDGKFTP